MHVPAAVCECHKTGPGLNQPAGHQHALTGLIAAVFVTQRIRFPVDVKRFLSFLRTEQPICSIVERVDSVQ